MDAAPVVTVLVVDDELDILETLVDYLSGGLRHARVVGAKNGEEAMQVIEELRPHIVLSDYRLPGASGLEVLRHAAYMGAHVNMMFTAYPDTDVATAALNSGRVTHFFVKPSQPRMLLLAIQDAVNQLLAGALREAAFERATSLAFNRSSDTPQPA